MIVTDPVRAPEKESSPGAAESKEARLPPPLRLRKTIVLVGLMGAGKTNIGRRLATILDLPFKDADAEIETAAGESIDEIFRNRGEAAFREGEAKVMARLLEEPVHILSTGGGAFMNPETRALIQARGISVWLRADLDVLLRRVARRTNRPLLKQGDPREVLEKLIAQRYPVYAGADITVDSLETPPEETVAQVVEALLHHTAREP